MPEIQIGKQLIAYREIGEGRPPLLLVHCAGGSSLSFGPVMGMLGRERRVVALDLPGHGRSPAFDAPPPVSELLLRYRDLCAEVAERLGLGRFVLVGHSMGGAVGLLFAAAYPDRLEQLVLCATAGRLRVAPELLSIIRKSFDALPALLGGFGYSPASDPAQVQHWAATQLQAPQEVVLADFCACEGFDLRPGLGAIQTPVRIISAADDRLTPPFLQERLAQALPRAELHRVSRAGHFVISERPEIVAELVLGRAALAPG